MNRTEALKALIDKLDTLDKNVERLSEESNRRLYTVSAAEAAYKQIGALVTAAREDRNLLADSIAKALKREAMVTIGDRIITIGGHCIELGENE